MTRVIYTVIVTSSQDEEINTTLEFASGSKHEAKSYFKHKREFLIEEDLRSGDKSIITIDDEDRFFMLKIDDSYCVEITLQQYRLHTTLVPHDFGGNGGWEDE